MQRIDMVLVTHTATTHGDNILASYQQQKCCNHCLGPFGLIFSVNRPSEPQCQYRRAFCQVAGLRQKALPACSFTP